MSFKFSIGEEVQYKDVVRKANGDKKYDGVKFAVLDRGLSSSSKKNFYRLRRLNSDKSPQEIAAWEVLLESVTPRCIVCGCTVEAESGLAKRHEHDGKLCYGSFVPLEAR